MIKVWTDAADAGLMDRHGDRGSTFAYLPDDPPIRAVSVTMPVRLESWSTSFGLLPIFEMNLPEGALRERLRLAFAKATGTFDEFDLLSIVGRSQVGRIRYTGDKEQLHEDVPFQSVDEIL
jgi:serine/threonine-protein kinase HipA